MRETTRNVITGLTGIVAALGFSAMLMLFGELDILQRGRWTVTVSLNDTGGLRAGSSVTLNGVPIGTVQSVETADDPQLPVRVVADIKAEQSIPRPITPTVQSSLLGGGATLRFQTTPGLTRFDDPFPRDGTATVVGTYSTMPEQVAEIISGQLGPLVDSLRGFGELAETYNTLGKDLDSLVAPLSDGELAEGTASNLRVTIRRLNSALAKAEESFSLANRWLGDGELEGDIRETVRGAKNVMATADEAIARYAKLADELGTDAKTLTEAIAADADRLVERLLPAADELDRTLRDVRSILKLASEGEGTVAQLLQRPDLYQSLQSAAVRLERALAETELLLQKVRQEGLRLQLK